MSTSTDAMLVYGYHLGGGDSGWLLEGLDEWGSWPESLDWYDPESEEGDSFQEAVEKRLLAQLAGFTETDWTVDGYFDRQREAQAGVGVEIETHCSGDFPMYLLVAKGVTAYRGTAKEIDFAALTAEVQATNADTKLQAALDALGIRPTQKQPQWLLCSYWG